ncbi:UrcA family protein [Asticcacaulis solisilvae]|uniref:UrcA family protein n=1 Tax=Asticcacaulis solisilvae TaxID=1217274 RepID=UPI003FD6F0F7
MSRMRTRIALISVTMLAAAGFAAAASAEDRGADQRPVYSRDIDFSKPAQVRTLYSRLQQVAYEVCRSEGERDPQTLDADKACEAQAVTDAVRDINQPQLTQLDDQKNGRTNSALALNDRGH